MDTKIRIDCDGDLVIDMPDILVVLFIHRTRIDSFLAAVVNQENWTDGHFTTHIQDKAISGYFLEYQPLALTPQICADILVKSIDAILKNMDEENEDDN